MTNRSGNDAITAVNDYLKSSCYDATLIADESIFRAKLEHELYSDDLYFKIYPEKEEFVFYAVAEFPVPEQHAPRVVEYLTRVNLGLIVGNFEFDYRGSKIRYKSGLCFAGEALSVQAVRNAVEPALATWNNYMPGAIIVMAGAATPIRALNEIDYGE